MLKKSLNGNWMLHVAGEGFPVSISGGVTTIEGLTITFKLGDNCKGTGTIADAMTTLPTTIAAEKISPNSTLKPNLMEVSFDGGSSITVFSFFRR